MVTTRELLEKEGIDCAKVERCLKELLDAEPTFAILHAMCVYRIITRDQEAQLIRQMDEGVTKHGEE